MPELTLEHADFEALAKEILACANCLRFRASGSSMRPFIWDGDLIELYPLGPGPLRRGDVVLCRLGPGRLVLHRIVRLEPSAAGPRLLIQGDARLAPDGSISAEAVLGRAVAVCHGTHRYSMDSRLVRSLVSVWMWLAPLRGKIFSLHHYF